MVFLLTGTAARKLASCLIILCGGTIHEIGHLLISSRSVSTILRFIQTSKLTHWNDLQGAEKQLENPCHIPSKRRLLFLNRREFPGMCSSNKLRYGENQANGQVHTGCLLLTVELVRLA